MKNLNTKFLVPMLFVVTMLPACGKKTADIEEPAQQVGDVMASVDESGGSSGTLAQIEDSHRRMFARLGDSLDSNGGAWSLIPEAQASYCSISNTFGACSGATMIRNFGGCSIGSASLSGTVTLVWGNGSSCSLSALNDTITRSPNFTLIGRRGATLSVTKSGSIGQRLTWISGSGSNKVFQFTNDGIQRVFTLPNGDKLLDFTTVTASPITVTGTTRSTGRSLNGGALRVTNNGSGVTCDYVPSQVTWSPTCNCAVSGSWSATCSDGKQSVINLTGCGTADFTMGTDSTSVTFDRCYGI